MFEFKKVLKSAMRGTSSQHAASVGRWKGDSGTAGEMEQIESFYRALEDGLRSLENSLHPDSLNFRVDFLQLAVDFLQRVHANTFMLVEKLWLPLRSISMLGAEYLNEYLDVSMRLLEMCNTLKEGLNQSETYHMSLELALKRLTKASENLQLRGHELGAVDWADDSSDYLKPLNEARQELERLDQSMRVSQTNMWGALLAGKLPASPGSCRTGSACGDLTKFGDVERPRVFSPGKNLKKRDMSAVLYDVQVVTSYVSCVLLWVLTGQSGDSDDFSSNVDALEPSSKLQRSKSWFRLKEKVSAQQSFKDMQNATGQLKLEDVKNFQNSLTSLRALLKAGMKEGKLAPDTALLERMKKLLEQQEQKLEELSRNLETISAQLNDMFTDIIERRKMVVDTFEQSTEHKPSV